MPQTDKPFSSSVMLDIVQCVPFIADWRTAAVTGCPGRCSQLHCSM